MDIVAFTVLENNGPVTFAGIPFGYSLRQRPSGKRSWRRAGRWRTGGHPRSTGVDESKTKIGCEISPYPYLYKYIPLVYSRELCPVS